MVRRKEGKEGKIVRWREREFFSVEEMEGRRC